MKSMKNQFNAVAGIPEKWLIVIEGYKMPGSNVWAEMTYIYDKLPAQRVHISFSIQEIKILCMQIEQLCLNFNVKD
jgi:hypothetical protein